MAKTKKSGNGNKNALVTTTEIGVPDYLTGKEHSGIEGLSKDDFKLPRIKLLQPMTPEVRTFAGKALPSEFWHTGANRSLGLEFYATPIIVSKKVVLFPPKNAGNEEAILAISKDGINWLSGGNQTFEVKLKDKKTKVTWSTGKNVRDSGLLEFGSSDPENPQSVPAATLFYEYLLYLRDYPDLSPVALSSFRTALNNARAFNTYLLSRRIPVNCNNIRIFSSEEHKGDNVWHVASFEPDGNAPKEVFELTEKWKAEYADYETEIDTGDEASELKSDDI